MSTHKKIDRICALIVMTALVITIIFCNGQAFGIETVAHAMGYENRLFDKSRVHSIDIVMNDWDGFISTCESEEYTQCNVVIDGEAVKNVGIRGKGNTSLSSVRNMNSSRYSFKIEFDQYDDTKSYHGLDKLCLNNIIQDNTFMKDYVAYTLMYDFGVAAPLCSFAYVTVNGEDWGLYLAVEAVEDSFIQRNYGDNYRELYKPDSMGFGGGRGNGRNFDADDFLKQLEELQGEGGEVPNFPGRGNTPGAEEESGETPNFQGRGNMPGAEGGEVPNFPGWGNMPGTEGEGGGMPNFQGRGNGMQAAGGRGGFGGMGSEDVKLKYIDDDPESYANIFGNAKTDVNAADKKRLIRSLKALSEQSDLERTVDVNAVIRYFVVHDFLCNGDSYTGQMIHNYYLYEEDGRLSMIPWDYNLAFGSFQRTDATSSVNSPIDSPVSGDVSDRPMIAWIFDNEEWLEQYHLLYDEFIGSADVSGLVKETAEMIAEYVQKDPTKFCTYEEFEKGVQALTEFCGLRSESVRGQLEGTIPSTTEGQRQNASALIDAKDLDLSRLGSSNMGRGGNFGGFPGQQAGGQRQGRGFAGQEQDVNTAENQAGRENNVPSMGSFQAMGVPTFAQGARQSQSNLSAYVLLGICALVLLTGLGVAFRYKK
ncbi:MAG: CotH kinase family protein [Lachnospiraceae bacterium]|nr:CotH kinase family protein [Lachnospiraceae bacterium]